MGQTWILGGTDESGTTRFMEDPDAVVKRHGGRR